MRDRSARFDRVIGSSHTIATRVDILLNRQVVLTDIAAESGEVTYDRTAAVMARALLSVAEPTRVPTVTDSGPLAPYGYEVQLWRGIDYRDGSDPELLSFFVGPIQKSSWDGVTLIGELDALDRSQWVVDAIFEEDYVIAAGTNTATAIQALIEAGVSGLTFAFQSTAFTTPAVVFSAGDDRWEAARALARSIGSEVYFDGYGRCVLRDEPGAQTEAALTIAEGDGGTLTGIDLDLDRAPAINRVICSGEAASNTVTYRGVATDDDPASPTFYDGPFGRKAMIFTSNLVTSDEQAATVAAAVLTAFSGVARSVSVSSVPNPALEPGDIIHITRAALDISELYIIDGFTIGLKADMPMGMELF